jgi:acyl CoA:acetate/3-ketoacid CoA transferase
MRVVTSDTAAGLVRGPEVACEEGKLKIVGKGRHRRFGAALQQLRYSGSYGRERGQTVTYVTERAVFRIDMAGRKSWQHPRTLVLDTVS